MQLQKTDKTILTPDEILKYISDYEISQVKEFDKLWNYYKGQNEKVLARTVPSQNDPNNKVPIPYGRKIVTTYTGYACKPHSTTYQAVEDKSEDEEADTESEMITESTDISEYDPSTQEKIKLALQISGGVDRNSFAKYLPPEPKIKTVEQQFADELQANYNLNNEHIKTSRAGRNTGIFGVAYELLYMDGAVNNDKKTNAALPVKAEPRFFSVDPREMILLYDYSSEPKKIIAIRFYKMTDDWYKVELYYKDKIIVYDRKRQRDPNEGIVKWVLIQLSESINFYGDIPVIAYYFGDEMLGLISPVIPIIDAYDTLISDSMNEYDKFAAAYLVAKGFTFVDPVKAKDPNIASRILENLKKKRIIEIPKDAETSYLTKDIPTAFVEFMSKKLKDEIHTQSHVPDFKDMATGTLSGAAIQRLLFDFENVVSSAEADFDTGLKERIRLIAVAFEKLNRFTGGTPDMISISHRRNLPADLKEKADTALAMKNAGFSRWLCADIMPDDVIPDVEEELRRQDEDNEKLMPDIEAVPEPEAEVDTEQETSNTDNMSNTQGMNNADNKTQIGEKK
jgi:SPP1 family phage portal protein